MIKNLLPREEFELVKEFKTKKIKALNYAIDATEKDIKKVGAITKIKGNVMLDLEELINEFGVYDNKFTFEIRVCNGVIYQTFKGEEYISKQTNLSSKYLELFIYVAMEKAEEIRSKLGVEMIIDAKEEKEQWCNCPYCKNYIIRNVNEENKRKGIDLFYSSAIDDNRLFYNEMESLGCLHNCGLED